MDLSLLAAPFDPRDVSWLPQSSGKTDRGPWVRVIAFIDNRAVMARLDNVCGPGNWRNEYRHEGKAVMCGLSIRVERREFDHTPTHEWVTKWDGAEESDIESVKGGLSGAMKRAAVQWGVGRYLYELGESFAVVSPSGQHYLKADEKKHGAALKWDAPPLPAWALPGGDGKAPANVSAQQRAAPAARPAPATKAATPAAEQEMTVERALATRIPGTKAHFRGHGGKSFNDVPSSDIVRVLQEVNSLGDKPQYVDLKRAARLLTTHLTHGGAK